MMEFENFKMPNIETMPGSEKGSTFLIISKKENTNLGIRVFLAPLEVKGSVWVSLCFRLRAASPSEVVSVDKAKKLFGDFPFYASNKHSSAVGITPLVAFPCSPAEVYTHYTSFNNELESNIVTQIKDVLSTVGGTLCIDDMLIAEALREHIKDSIPELSVVTNSIPKMLWLPGHKAG